MIGASRATDRRLLGAPVSRASFGARRSSHLALREIAAKLAPIALCFAFVLTVTLSLSATPRRTGDAHQYLAMALQLSELRPPSLSPTEVSAFRGWLEAQPTESGFPDGTRAIRQPALIRDGRQEFSHFWLYPLLAAPATGVATAVGFHPLAAFTITNTLLLGAALWVTARTFGSVPALLVIGSPLVWFLARAQVEIFTVSLLCLAMAAAVRGRWGWAALAVATASTQNAPIAATIPIFWGAAIAEWVAVAQGEPSLPRARSGRIRASSRVRFGCSWRCSLASRLLPAPSGSLDASGAQWRHRRRLANRGTLSRAADRSRYRLRRLDADHRAPHHRRSRPAREVRLARRISRTGVLLSPCSAQAAMCVWFLFVFSQTTNVNSGGTLHVSRYALWLIPLTLPAIAVSTSVSGCARTGHDASSAVFALFAAYLSYFHPDQGERYVEHSPQAAWLMTHVPAAYRPIPEIFVERTLHIDGGARASAADPACRLVLVVAAQPDQPCALTALEQVSLQEKLPDGDAAVWIRRGRPRRQPA